MALSLFLLLILIFFSKHACLLRVLILSIFRLAVFVKGALHLHLIAVCLLSLSKHKVTGKVTLIQFTSSCLRRRNLTSCALFPLFITFIIFFFSFSHGFGVISFVLPCLFSINSVLPETFSLCYLFVFSNLVVLTWSKPVIRNTPPIVCGLVFRQCQVSPGSTWSPDVPKVICGLSLFVLPTHPQGVILFFLPCLFSIYSVLPQTFSVCYLFVFSNLTSYNWVSRK